MNEVTTVVTQIRNPIKPSKGVSTNIKPTCMMHIRNHIYYLKNRIRYGASITSGMNIQDYSNCVYLLDCVLAKLRAGHFNNLPEFPNGKK